MALRAASEAFKAGSNGNTAVALDGLRVLVVEDDGDGREAIAMLLTTAGADVIAVASTQAALAAMADGVPHVLVSDIGLPVEDGYVLIRKVRELGTDPLTFPGLEPARVFRPVGQVEERHDAAGDGSGRCSNFTTA